jgi:hypothetical protein
MLLMCAFGAEEEIERREEAASVTLFPCPWHFETPDPAGVWFFWGWQPPII